MGKKILYRQNTGKIAIMSLAQDTTVDQAITTLPLMTDYCIIDEDQLPNDNDLAHFFDALTVDFTDTSAPQISIDITGARAITKERLRRARIPLFEANDLIIRDAMIENDAEKLAAAIAERDRLRNITVVPDTIDTLDGLRNLHP